MEPLAKKDFVKEKGVGSVLYNLGLGCLGISVLGPRLADQFGIVRSASKKFSTFEEFYPFYLSQHENDTCRHLHFLGSILVLLMMAMDSSILVSMFFAACAGYGTMHLTRGMDSGIVEFAVTLFVLIHAQKKIAGKSLMKSLRVPLIGYVFAWIGHFYFEKNKPATFIYPIYSLCGDFKMLYEFLNAFAIRK